MSGESSVPNRIFLATLGLVTFASGVGSALGVSPLFINLLAGVSVSALSPHAERISQELQRLKHPMYVLLMIFAGILWSSVSGWAWLLPLVYVGARFASLWLWLALTDRAVLPSATFVPRLGQGLLGQGIFAVAIAINLALRVGDRAGIVLNTVLFGVLSSDLFPGRRLRSVLADAGELDQVGAASEPAPASNPAPEA